MWCCAGSHSSEGHRLLVLSQDGDLESHFLSFYPALPLSVSAPTADGQRPLTQVQPLALSSPFLALGLRHKLDCDPASPEPPSGQNHPLGRPDPPWHLALSTENHDEASVLSLAGSGTALASVEHTPGPPRGLQEARLWHSEAGPTPVASPCWMPKPPQERCPGGTPTPWLGTCFPSSPAASAPMVSGMSMASRRPEFEPVTCRGVPSLSFPTWTVTLLPSKGLHIVRVQ